ncbi:DUF4410 domain-containing protein [Granulibacter bethesdensis]|uniref:DUF4410 domain-containing protein n=1 Tax=Granulibacter bethesdensis TaxID=364410 RepID=UPI0003F1EBE0|nr:DUF4410 domain-containing protein [Granulibacter bethesdensis]APG31137.1 putative secreted protein [Granulibacter bethesdensis CGDNIH4]
MMINLFRLFLGAIMLAFLSACATARVQSNEVYHSTDGAPPPVVYVADFTLNPETIHAEGLLAKQHILTSQQDEVHDFVELMANTLVADLAKAGLTARRLQPGEPTPTAGWLVRGRFVSIDEGNRLKRSMIGFGSGQTSLQIETTVENLSTNQPPVLLETMNSEAQSGKKPGGILMLNPYVAAASFVLAGYSTDTDVKNTAHKIADALITSLMKQKQSGPSY